MKRSTTPTHRPAPGHQRRTVLTLAALLALPLPLTACGSDASSSAPAAGAATSAASAGSSGHDHALTFESSWVKAGSGMTAAFGTITNPGDHAVTIVKGSSPAAGMVQLHTMQMQADGSMKMIEKKGGFVVPAKGSLTLDPGGDHIMLMDLPAALSNGQDVTFSMVADDGETFDWTVPVRSFAGAEETYSPDAPSSEEGKTPMPSMDGMTSTGTASN